MQTIQVDLGADSYPIHIGAGLLAQAGKLIRPLHRGGRVLVVADATVATFHGAGLLASLHAAGLDAAMECFAAGEPSKSLETADRLWQACARERVDRAGLVIGFGGGVSGDLAGFVAACWMRGVDFVQIPTTLLAMVDSSVGGKTGVNSAAGKNLIGAFWQPKLVIADTDLLKTMAEREYRAGLAEILKYGVIREPDFLRWQEQHALALAAGEASTVAEAVARSCACKAWYVAMDPQERGVRAELNYGHTFGHALERETQYKRFLHGEAVGLGMRMAVTLASRIGLLLEPNLAARQDALLQVYGLPLTYAGVDGAILDRLVAHCRLDKKVQAGSLRFIVPERAGVVRRVADPESDDVRAAFASACLP